jgi:hypothetical protein
MHQRELVPISETSLTFMTALNDIMNEKVDYNM